MKRLYALGIILCVAVLGYSVTAQSATTSRAYLPSARGANVPPARTSYDLRPSDGLVCFHSDVTPEESGDGAIFWNALCQNGEGQNVFRTDANGTRRVLKSSQGGRGSLFVGRDGYLYLAASSFDVQPPFTRVEAVPGWVR